MLEHGGRVLFVPAALPPVMEPAAVVADYYRCLDADDYAALEALLSPEFTQQRPDRTFESPEAFVDFMSTERPVTGTTHETAAPLSSADSLAVAGELLDSDGEELFAFIDVFAFDEAGRIRSLVTHS